jgi:hypothetical protein
VVALSKAWVWGFSFTGIMSSNPSLGMDFVSCDCSVLSGVAVRLITSPEESYRLWYAQCICDGEASSGKATEKKYFTDFNFFKPV